MNGDLQAIEAKRQELLGQIRTAEAAMRAGLHITGFGNAAREHLERAMAHIQEAYIAINETKAIRSVSQLVDDLNRIQQVMNQHKTHRV